MLQYHANTTQYHCNMYYACPNMNLYSITRYNMIDAIIIQAVTHIYNTLNHVTTCTIMLMHIRACIGMSHHQRMIWYGTVLLLLGVHIVVTFWYFGLVGHQHLGTDWHCLGTALALLRHPTGIRVINQQVYRGIHRGSILQTTHHKKVPFDPLRDLLFVQQDQKRQ